MKSEHVLKSFSALSFDGKAVRASAAADEEKGDVASMSEQFRAMLQERYSAPYAFASAYRHWGINE